MKKLKDLRFTYIGTVGERKEYVETGALVQYSEMMGTMKAAIKDGMSLEEFLGL